LLSVLQRQVAAFANGMRTNKIKIELEYIIDSTVELDFEK